MIKSQIFLCLLLLSLSASGTVEKPAEPAPWEPFAARWEGVKAAMTTPMEKLVIPLEHHANGRVRVRLYARLAQIFDQGNTLFAEDIRVELLDDRGTLEGELKAEGCLFDRKTKCGYCKGRVFLKKDGDQIKGEGLFFSSGREFIKILDSCEIRTKRFKESFGRI